MADSYIDGLSARQVHFQVDKETLNLALRTTGFLLIPDTDNDTVGMFDAFDGSYLGDLIDGKGILKYPMNAVQGPDGDIYVSDQEANSVFVFDIAGNYLYTYADSTDGLDTPWGIDFFGGHLFVACNGHVAEFDAPHSRLPNFIDDGSNPTDILFLSDGTCLLSDCPGTCLRYYDAGGNSISNLFSVVFPTQIQSDSVTPGDFLVCSFAEVDIKDFTISGMIVQSTPLLSIVYGVYRLKNDNFLTSQGAGVFENAPVTGDIIGFELLFGGPKFIEFVSPSGGSSLTADTDQLSIGGGTVNFTLDAGISNAGRSYLLCGTVSGTSPGTPLPGGLATIPINKDWVTNYIIRKHLSSPNFTGFSGTLDVNGEASAKLDTMGPLPGNLPVGTVMHFAFALSTPWDYVSIAIAVEVVP